MRKISLVADTNASLPKEIIEKYQIIEVPIKIQFAEETYITGETIDDAKLFSLIDERKVIPTTAAPSPSAFEQAFTTALESGAEQIICICCSGEVSATYNSAVMAKENFLNTDIYVIDSLGLSLAEGFQVLAAAEAIEAGKDMPEIIKSIEHVRDRTIVYGALPTLKYLALGGRMGKLAAGVGNTLEIKPILTLRDGKLDLFEKVRTWRKAKRRLVELAVDKTSGAVIERVGLIHVNNEEGVLDLYDELKKALNITLDPVVAEFTPGLSVHTGSGVIAFAIILQEPEKDYLF